MALSWAAAAVNAFPEPAIVSKAWNLDLTYQHPRLIAVPGIDGGIRWFWYMTYKVVNNTGEDHLFIPEVTVFTDTGQIFFTDRAVPAAAFNAVKDRVENPLLENPAEIVGKILQGPDHARESVAIWPVLDEDIDHITVFFSGTSGETQAIKNPATGKRVVLRKTLMIDYDLPGTTRDIQNKTIVPKGEKWIMR